MATILLSPSGGVFVSVQPFPPQAAMVPSAFSAKLTDPFAAIATAFVRSGGTFVHPKSPQAITWLAAGTAAGIALMASTKAAFASALMWLAFMLSIGADW